MPLTTHPSWSEAAAAEAAALHDAACAAFLRGCAAPSGTSRPPVHDAGREARLSTQGVEAVIP